MSFPVLSLFMTFTSSMAFPLVWDDGLYVQSKKVNAIFLLLLDGGLRCLKLYIDYYLFPVLLPRAAVLLATTTFSLTQTLQSSDDHLCLNDERENQFGRTFVCYLWGDMTLP